MLRMRGGRLRVGGCDGAPKDVCLVAGVGIGLGCGRERLYYFFSFWELLILCDTLCWKSTQSDLKMWREG